MPTNTARSAPVAFITGGSSGIGLALANLLAQRGYDLALIARNPERLSTAMSDIGRAHPIARVQSYSADVGDEKALGVVLDAALDDFGVPDLAIACAGISLPGRFLDSPLEEVRRSMRVNFEGSAAFAHRILPGMVARGAGHLVLVSSGAALSGIYGYGAYGASKFALRGLAETLKVEMAAHNVGVTICYPPDTDTPMLTAERPLRPAETEEIAGAGSVISAAHVARAILRGVERERFAVAPGMQMGALLWLHSVVGPLFRRYQITVAKRHGKTRTM